MDPRIAGKMLCLVYSTIERLNQSLVEDMKKHGVNDSSGGRPLPVHTRNEMASKCHDILGTIEEILESCSLSEIPEQRLFINIGAESRDYGREIERTTPTSMIISGSDLADKCVSLIGETIHLLGVGTKN